MEGVGYSLVMGEVALKPIQEDTRRHIDHIIPDFIIIIIHFELKNVFIQEDAGPAGAFNKSIHDAQNVTNTVAEDSMERMILRGTQRTHTLV